MTSPPKDGDGNVTPHDDPTAIPDDSFVVRYIPSRWLVSIQNNKRRLSKGAFSGSNKGRDPYQGMSTDMLHQLESDGIDPASRRKPDDEAAVVIRAGELRDLGFKVGPDPMKINDKYHASVWGVRASDRKNILKLAHWLIKPPDVD